MTARLRVRRPHLSAPATAFGALLGAGAIVIFGGLMLSCILTLGIWPGQVKLVAPLFCTDAQPDPFVVADTHNPHPGETVTNFTLYCMGPRGDATDHGFMGPFLATALLNGIVLLLVAVVLTLLIRRRMRARVRPLVEPTGLAPPVATAPPRTTPPGPPSGPGPGSTPGPFVN